MKVRILETDKRLRIKAGEIYIAERYKLDPDKVTLLERIPDGFEPECNQYFSDIEIIKNCKK